MKEQQDVARDGRGKGVAAVRMKRMRRVRKEEKGREEEEDEIEASGGLLAGRNRRVLLVESRV